MRYNKPIKDKIIQALCAKSHVEFMKKCKDPLWLNPKFFIELPFKDGVTTNLTKASHLGMNLEHLLMEI